MTEPPIPPGSDDPGEDDREFDEFFASEQFAELEDDMLLDRAGEGDDNRTLADDLGLPEEEHDLQDMLFDAHDAVTEEPVPDLVSTDEAMKIIADATRRRDEEAAAKRSRGDNDTEGSPMAISDDAAQLNQMAEDGDAVLGQLGSVTGRLDDATNAVSAVASAIDNAAAPAVGAADYLTTVAGTAQGLLGGAEGDQVAGLGMAAAAAVNDVTTALMSNSAAIETLLAQIQSVGPVVETAQQMVQAFFAELKDAARRHSR